MTSSSTVIAALEGARDVNAPVILQVSQGGAAFFGGKGLKNDKQQGSIAGAVAMAHYVRAIAPSYGMYVFPPPPPSFHFLDSARINSVQWSLA